MVALARRTHAYACTMVCSAMPTHPHARAVVSYADHALTAAHTQVPPAPTAPSMHTRACMHLGIVEGTDVGCVEVDGSLRKCLVSANHDLDLITLVPEIIVMFHLTTVCLCSQGEVRGPLMESGVMAWVRTPASVTGSASRWHGNVRGQAGQGSPGKRRHR